MADYPSTIFGASWPALSRDRARGIIGHSEAEALRLARTAERKSAAAVAVTG